MDRVAPTRAQIRAALEADQTIDIVTIGARSGRPQTTEIWFTNVSGRIIICGTPGAKGGNGARVPRDWLANLIANPDFLFCLKESVQASRATSTTPARSTLNPTSARFGVELRPSGRAHAGPCLNGRADVWK